MTSNLIQSQLKPTQEHMLALYELELPQLDFREFIKRWQVPYRVLADVCLCSEATVQRWFSGKACPSQWHQYRMALVDEMWRKI